MLPDVYKRQVLCLPQACVAQLVQRLPVLCRDILQPGCAAAQGKGLSLIHIFPMIEKEVQELLSFIDGNPTAYHTTASVRNILLKEGDVYKRQASGTPGRFAL